MTAPSGEPRLRAVFQWASLQVLAFLWQIIRRFAEPSDKDVSLQITKITNYFTANKQVHMFTYSINMSPNTYLFAIVYVLYSWCLQHDVFVVPIF